MNLAITGATQEALTIFQDVKSANVCLPPSYLRRRIKDWELGNPINLTTVTSRRIVVLIAYSQLKGVNVLGSGELTLVKSVNEFMEWASQFNQGGSLFRGVEEYDISASMRIAEIVCSDDVLNRAIDL